MTSTDFDGIFGRLRRIFVILNENPYFFNKGNIEIAENPIKTDRDHRDIPDIGSRDLVFRVFQVLAVFPMCFEVNHRDIYTKVRAKLFFVRAT